MSLTPPPGFAWEQRDAGRLRCEDCGETVQAVCVDLHRCGGACDTCDGYGHVRPVGEPDAPVKTCPTCEGDG